MHNNEATVALPFRFGLFLLPLVGDGFGHRPLRANVVRRVSTI